MSGSVPGMATGRARGRAKGVETRGEQMAAARRLAPQPSEGAQGGYSAQPAEKNVTAADEICTMGTGHSTANTNEGTSEQPVNLITNYFEFRILPGSALYKYRVSFSPEVESTMMRKELMRSHKKVLGGYIFDGSMLFTAARIATEPTELFSAQSTDAVNIRITLQLVGDLVEGDENYSAIFNILMRMSLEHLKRQLLERNFLDALAKIEMKQFKLELPPGYSTSIRQHEYSTLASLEITHNLTWEDSALDAYNRCLENSPSDYEKSYMEKIVGTVIYYKGNNRAYRVDDVDFQATPETKLVLSTGEQISYIEHCRRIYGLQVNQTQQPLLVSRATSQERRAGKPELTYLVPELSLCTGFADEMRANSRLTDNTRIDPAARFERLQRFNLLLAETEKVVKLFRQWNMGLAKNLVTFTGQELPEEKEMAMEPGPQTNWTKSLSSSPIISAGDLWNWAVILPTRWKRDTKSFIGKLQKAGSRMSLSIGTPHFHEISDDHPGTYVEAIEEVICSRNPQLVMCVVTNKRSDCYSAIKKKCSIDRPIPSQLILTKSLNSKRIMDIATKVAFQMNCKIGSAPWNGQSPMTKVMIAGFDVPAHDPGLKSKSFGALVCSLDKAQCKYFSAVSHHTAGEELSNDLSTNMMMALNKFREYNQGELPCQIFFYRDGVDEGQITYVCQHEVDLLQENLSQIYGGQSWKLVYILINTRLNPPPRTIADDVITSPEKYNFITVSQSHRHGKVLPTAFKVISDNIGVSADKLQRLTKEVTQTYFNWSETVRVPAPVMYAHKLAMLAGQSLHRPPNTGLQES